MMKKIITYTLAIILSIFLISCEVTPEVNQYKITYERNDMCDISLSKELASVNEEIVVTVSNINDGYVLDKITANGMRIDNNKFMMPKEDVVVKVVLKETEKSSYSVNIIPSEYAVISTRQSQYKVGASVQLEYKCKGHYILDKFYINGNAIEGTTFTMPNEDVEVKATFVNGLPNTDWQLTIESGTNVGRSYWYFKYEETGLAINVKVDDRLVCGYEFSQDIGWQDNVEIIISPRTEQKGWSVDKSVKILASCTNQFFVQKATESNVFTTVFDFENHINVNVIEKTLENNDGYNGYEVNMFVSYEYLNMTKDGAIGNISACLSMRNTNTFGATVWNCFAGKSGNWENANTHPIILADGRLSERR